MPAAMCVLGPVLSCDCNFYLSSSGKETCLTHPYVFVYTRCVREVIGLLAQGSPTSALLNSSFMLPKR